MEFDGIVPVFTCDICGHVDITWKIFYETYLQLYKVRENWDEPKNAVSCILGLFCYYYKDFYNLDYTFIPRNPNPYGVKECRDAWTLLAMFNKDIHEVRRYIVWLFNKGLSRGTTITNFGYILTPALVQKYKLQAIKKIVLTRASKLPDIFLERCRINFPEIFKKVELGTMNDLAQLMIYSKGVPGEIESKVVEVAEQIGLIKDGKLISER